MERSGERGCVSPTRGTYIRRSIRRASGVPCIMHDTTVLNVRSNHPLLRVPSTPRTARFRILPGRVDQENANWSVTAITFEDSLENLLLTSAVQKGKKFVDQSLLCPWDFNRILVSLPTEVEIYRITFPTSNCAWTEEMFRQRFARVASFIYWRCCCRFLF